MKHSYRVIELETEIDNTNELGFRVLGREDIGELLLNDEDYLDDGLVRHHLIDQGYLRWDEKVTIEGDEDILHVMDGRPMYVLTRDDS